MFRLFTLLTSLLLAGPAVGQVVGGGVGQVIGLGVGGQTSTTASIANGGGGTLVADATAATVDLNFQTNTGFTNGVSAPAPSLLTVTRAAPPAYADDTNGNWYAFGANVPRITNKGLLVEEARTQLVNDTVGTFGPWGTSNATIGMGQSSPASDTSAFVWKDSTVNSVHYVYGSITGGVAGTTYTVSTFYRYAGLQYVALELSASGLANYFYVNVDVLNGVITQTGAAGTGAFTSAGIQVYPNGWIRVWATGVINTNAPTQVAYAGLATGTSLPSAGYAGTFQSVYVWNPQVEAATFPTSPIPNTTGASVTRAADQVTLTNVPTNGAVGSTIYAGGVSASPISNPANQHILTYLDAPGNNYAIIRRIGGTGLNNVALQTTTNGLLYNQSGILWQQNAQVLTAFSFKSGTEVGAMNGASVTAGATAYTLAAGTLTTFNIGGSFGQAFDGYIQRVALWPNTAISQIGVNSLTSTPGILAGDGVQASVDLNFVTNTGFNQGLSGTAASQITTSRTTTPSVGSWADDTSGVWHLFADNVPRITNKGLLVEEARTQLVPSTTGTTNWAASNYIRTGQPSPAGTNDAFLFQNDGTNNPQFTYIALNIPGGATITASAFYSAAGSQFNALIVGDGALSQAMWVNFDVINGVITTTGTSGASTIVGSGTVVYPNGWVRVWVAGTVGGSPTTIIPVTSIALASGTTPPGPPGTTGIGKNILIWCPQVEQGTFPTSPMPNTTLGTIARSADVITLTSVPTFGNAATLFASGVPNSPLNNPNYQWVAHLWNTSANRIDLARSLAGSNQGGMFALTLNNGAQQGSILGPIINPGVFIKTAVGVGDATTGGGQAVAWNGSAAAPFATSNAWPPAANMNALVIGSQFGTSNFWDGYVTRVATWPTYRVTNPGLQTITSGP